MKPKNQLFQKSICQRHSFRFQKIMLIENQHPRVNINYKRCRLRIQKHRLGQLRLLLIHLLRRNQVEIINAKYQVCKVIHQVENLVLRVRVNRLISRSEVCVDYLGDLHTNQASVKRKMVLNPRPDVSHHLLSAFIACEHYDSCQPGVNFVQQLVINEFHDVLKDLLLFKEHSFLIVH